MCVLSIKVPYEKSLETYLMILVYDFYQIFKLRVKFNRKCSKSYPSKFWAFLSLLYSDDQVQNGA